MLVTDDALVTQKGVGVSNTSPGAFGAITDSASLVLSSGVPGEGYMQLVEGTALTNGASNTVKIYARDNGGATQLVAVLPGDDVVPLAIDPVP